MKIRISILTLSLIIAFGLNGCGNDYEWDTNNTSTLEGKYDKTTDMPRAKQISIAKTLSKTFLYTNYQVAGISVSILFDDNATSTDFAYGCAKLKDEVIAMGYLTYDINDTQNCQRVLTPTNRLKVGSITKTTVARTVLDIDENSSYDFDLNEPITKYLPSNILALGDFSGISVNQLLHHTSGLAEIDFIPGSVEEILSKVINQPRVSNPGQYYSYNNAGYIILGQIIKYVTKADSWESEVQKRIDSSLGANSFIFPESANDNWIETSDTSWFSGKAGILTDKSNSSLAIGYQFDGVTLADVVNISAANIANSSGSLIGSIPDVTRWMKSISTNNSNLLSNDYFKNHVGDINPNTYTDSYISHHEWNMGPGLGYNQDQNALFHLGLFTGYACASIYSKNEKITITTCINSRGTLTELPYQILEAMYPYRTHYLPQTTTSSH